MRVLFALPGFHEVDRGAETALLAVARQLVARGVDVTVAGSGQARPGAPYTFHHVGAISRRHFASMPALPAFRNDTAYEDLSFALCLAAFFDPNAYDITVTSNYPHTNWMLRRPVWRGRRPRHVFVTQNGDWPAFANTAEFRFFNCDGLVCTNPDYYQRNRQKWNACLIPNGIDADTFQPGPSARSRFNLPLDAPVVLMVSALIESKRVLEGIEATAALPEAHLVVAGSGPLAKAVEERARALMPGRFTNLTLSPGDMPLLYNSVDALLHMSIEESFGNIFLEAMATGLPIVAHDSSRLRWIVGDNEHLVDTTSFPSVTAALRRALVGRHHPTNTIQKRIEKFTWANVAGQYLDFFAEVVKARRP